MKPRVVAVLRLMRPANVCTAAADVTAGALYMGARLDDWREWALLAGASALLYAGGVTLNDACDAPRDAIERPERPIPSGLLSRRAAFLISAILLVSGVLLASLFSRLAMILAIVLVGAIVLYDATLKATILGPPVMGLCRALNFALGLSLVPEYRTIPGLIPVLLFVWLYVASLTLLARDEHATSNRRRLFVALTGLIISVMCLTALLALVPGVRSDYLIGVVLLIVIVIRRVKPTLRHRDAACVQRAVAGLVLSIVLFDACIAWAARGFIGALVVLAWFVPAKLLARAFRVT